MNINKFTKQSMEAIATCENLAVRYGNQEIEQEHLLYALLTVNDSTIKSLIEKMEINAEHFTDRAQKAIEKRVKVQGGDSYVGRDLNKVLTMASL